jgi:hypothetical protein
MRVLTREGCPRLAELVDKEAELWSGQRWVRACVRMSPRATALYRVRLDSGASLVCAADHPWAVVTADGIKSVATRDLAVDSVVPHYLPLAVEDSGSDSGSDSADPATYRRGRAFGQRVALPTKGPRWARRGAATLPPEVFTYPPRDLAAFVAGWMDAQHGYLIGPHGVVLDLQIALCRLGATNTHIEHWGTNYALTLSSDLVRSLPNPNNQQREARQLSDALPRVTEVYSLRGQHRPCTLSVREGHTVVLGGILTSC